jgi:hypothetical protein
MHSFYQPAIRSTLRSGAPQARPGRGNWIFEAAWEAMIAFAGNSSFIAACAFALVGLAVPVSLTILFPPSAEAVEMLARFL